MMKVSMSFNTDWINLYNLECTEVGLTSLPPIAIYVYEIRLIETLLDPRRSLPELYYL